MLGDILLERCKEGIPVFQEDDGDGKVPVSALTRRDDHWSGGNNRSSVDGRSDLHTAFRTLSWVWEPLRPCPLSVPANGSRRSLWRSQYRAPTVCAQVCLLDNDMPAQSLCRAAS